MRSSTIDYSLFVNGVTNPTAAQIHSGAVGVAGLQQSIFDLMDAVPQSERRIDDYFVTDSTSGGPIVVYAAVVDNHTGDGY
ncbi:MAG TPA: hypothetical protein VFW15_09680, partial [Thermoanaerobaculia bacterium]|nr:hypothetical protein [Thermoanaerobaculia bacterium]